MKYIFSRDMHLDLWSVDRMFQYGLGSWWDELITYINEMEGDPTFNVLPAATIIAYRNLGLEKELSVAMANIFKTLYFASCIHATVKDSEEGQEHNQKLQFTILIGDYIFGRILKLLLEAEAGSLLDDFSQLMCEISEGMMLEFKTDSAVDFVLQKTRGSLYSTAFLTAARMARLDKEQVRDYEEIGYHLGLALELMYKQENTLSEQYRMETETLIEEFGLHCSDTAYILEPFVRELFKGFLVIPAAVG